MKGSLFRFLLALFPLTALTGCAVEQPRFQATATSTREAIARGEVREALNVMETKASEAEKKAASSLFPRQYWEEAAESYAEASSLAFISGHFQKAISHGTRAFEIAERLREPQIQARASYFLGFAHRRLGQHAKVREWVERGIEVTKQIPPGPPREAWEGSLHRLSGFDFLRQGEFKKAIEHLSYALQLQESRLAFFMNVPQGRLNPDAIPMAQHLVALGLQGLAAAYQRAGHVEEAIEIYEKGIRVIKESGVKTQAGVYLYHGLGQIYLRKNHFNRALENIQRALQMAEEQQLGSYIYLVSGDLGNLFLQTQRPFEAIPYYKKAIENIESTRSLLESEELRSSFFEDKREIYAGMIATHLRTKNAAEAFNYNERARSRAFLDILGSKVQLARGGTLLEHERALQARISVLQAMMGGQDPDSPQTTRLRKELAEAQQAYNEFLVKVRQENKEQASLMNVEPLTLKEVQELLDPGVTMLEYFVVREAVLLWVVEKDRLRFVNIAISRSDLVNKVTAIRDSIFQIGERERFKNQAQELYRLLIEPAMSHVRGKELLIIPHDVLHYLPYQALLSPQGRYLIQDYPIYYLSSASLMQFTKEKRRASRDRALAMGNPNLGDLAYNLRFAEREARELGTIYPKSSVFLNADATKSKVMSLSSNYDILHFAVHGELKEDDPLGSGLLLATEGRGDGRLSVGEIFSLNLKADTVVLSACETALGKITSGDEIIGLTRAFIYAGTPSIITTLWKVNDRASYELMREFYSNLKAMKKSEALRQAQLKTMQEFPEPFFWAAYGLTGEP